MNLLASLDDIAANYDAVFCDVWGVVHNGRKPYASACAALQRFRERGGQVILVTNVPKPRGPIPGQFDRIGVPRQSWDAIVTSGDAIRYELAKRAPAPFYKIGPEDDAVLWEGLDLQHTDIQHAAFFAISGLAFDGSDSPEDYADVLQAARARGLDLLCANPDIQVRVGDRLYWCAGAVARDYEKIGGRTIMAGKPHPPIYALAERELEFLAGRKIGKSRILAIGDGIPTDVKGANDQGLDCLFIASGMHGEALMTNGQLDESKITAALAKYSVQARYAMLELA